MNEHEYLAYDATGLAELVARREVSAAELLELAIGIAARKNPQLNSIVYPFYELAKARARQPLSGPFAGVPFLQKDLFQHYAGVPSSWGNKAKKRAAIPAPDHDEITKRWLAAGVVSFGLTNTPELGAKGITEPEAWGPTRNPWNTEHSPGGSSGGSAAAVASGIVPMAGANDGGGSIRIPASYTGLFGLKPGRYRTPAGPWMHTSMHGAAVNHVVSRSVRDSARMLDASHGHEVGGWAELAPPTRPYADEAAQDPRALRIAFSTRSPLGHDIDHEATHAVENAAKLLESLGHHVEIAEPAINGEELARTFVISWFSHCATTVEQFKRDLGEDPSGFENDTLAMAAVGRSLRATEYLAAHEHWYHYGRALAQFHQRYALYMTPTVAGTAPLIGSVRTPPALAVLMRGLFRARAGRVLRFAVKQTLDVAFENLRHVPFTQLANLTGTPAMSVPLHVAANGLPIGVQFVAAPGGEGTLFALAGQLERAAPWRYRFG